MIDLQLSSKLFVPIFYPYLSDYSHRQELYMGSAGSAKSYFITQKLIIRALREQIRILICRRYGTTIRNSCFSLCKDILKKWKIAEYVKINESDMRIRFSNGSEIVFLGLDDENKLLSINDIGCVFIEEAYECTQDIVEQLNLRMRGHNDNQQIILAQNPINKNHWLYNFSETSPPESSLYLHSTFRDNPFLPADNRKAIEELETRNPQKQRVFGLGEQGTDSDGLVFTNQEIKPLDVMQLASKYERRAGCDLGFVDPSTVIETYYNRDSHEIYITNEFYRSGVQLDIVSNAIKEMHLDKVKLYMDSAEPRSIDYMRKQNINAYPCIKGPDSVEARILFLQNHKIIVSPECSNLIRELENFSYIKDRQTSKYTDKMTHEYSHAIDALGYAYSDIYTKGKLRTLDKNVLGL